MLIRRRKHTVPALNTTSTADISFMLLIFFLVTSSMDVDSGLVRQLPPLDDSQTDEEDYTEVSRDNTLSFKIDAQGKVALNGKIVSLEDLRTRIYAFLKPRTNHHVIYIDSDPNADYDVYFKLENEIVAAYNSVRNDIAKKRFGHSYAQCSEEQKKTVRQMCPQQIAETYNESKGEEQ